MSSLPSPPKPSPPPQRESGWQRLNQGAPIAVMLAAMLIILYRLLPVLELIAIAVLLAIIFETLLQWLQNWVKFRWLALLILISFMLGFVALIVFVVVPNLVQEFNTLSTALPGYISALSQNAQVLQNKLGFAPDFSEGINRLSASIYSLIESIPNLLSRTFDITINAIATFVLGLYIAHDSSLITKGIVRVAPSTQKLRVKRIMTHSKAKLQGWLFGTLIAMLFLGVTSFLGLWLIGIPLPLSFGVIAGLLEIIPYFGSIVGTFLPALIALTISPVKLLLVLGLFLILNQIDAHIVQPIVVGQQVNLRPAVVIIAFLIMGELFGFIGIIIAVPTAAIMLAVFEELT